MVEQLGEQVIDPAGVEFLASLPMDVQKLVTAAFDRVNFSFGDVLLRENDPADSFWVLSSGRVRVLRQGDDGEEVLLASLGPGATFGEGALLLEGQRTSTVRATTAGSALRLDAAVLRAVAASQPSVQIVLSGMRRRHEVADLLRLASPLARVAGGALPQLVELLSPMEVREGEVVAIEGEIVDSLYLVEQGQLVVSTLAEDGDDRRRYFRRGDLIGEAALISGYPSSETVTAFTDAVLLRLSKAQLDELTGRHPEIRRALEDLAAAYDHERVARLPLDFARLNGDVPRQFAAIPQPTQPRDPSSDDQLRERRSRFRRFTLVRQIDEVDCGVAALSMICRHYGKRVPLSRLRVLVGTGVDGTSAGGLLGAARTLGLEGRVVKASKSELANLPTPAIVHWQGDHWVVLTRVGAESATFFDPALGRRRLPVGEFRDGWTGYVIEATPGPEFQPGGGRFDGLEWLSSLARPHLGRIAIVAAMAVTLSALELSLEVVTQVVIDRIVRPGQGANIGSILAILGAVALVLTFGTLIQRLLILRTSTALDREGLQLLSGRLLSLPLSYFASRRTGDLQRRLDGLRQARMLATDIGVLSLALGAQLVASVALLFAYSIPIGVAFCVAVPGYLLIARLVLGQLGPATASLEEEAGRYASRQIEIVKGIETAKALAAESFLQMGLVQHQSELATRQNRVDRLRAGYAALTQGLGFAILAGFLALATEEVLNHSLSVGALVACVTLVALATYPMQQLLVLADSFQHARVLTGRAQDVFDTKPEQDVDRSFSPVPSISGHVTLRELTFSYSDSGPPVLDDISVDIPAGMTVAVVGRSGSGKTTLARCVAGLVAPTSGSVCFDGIDAAGLDHGELRRHIGFVLQETYLFSDTIEANIALGYDLDVSRVREAAHLANAHEFIERLPLGYSTKVGESGMALSGGQSQRLAIARALYSRPAVLVLDEATSALDAESERAVQGNLERVLGDRTALIIAHRLSTVRHADLILVLDRGRLVERGTHEELVALRGLYFLLAAQQLDL